MVSDDGDTGKTILRDDIKATVGLEKLGAATGSPPKSLIRTFGPRGNPPAKNLFSVVGYLQKRAGLRLHVSGIEWSATSEAEQNALRQPRLSRHLFRSENRH